MEAMMTKNISDLTLLYVDTRELPYQVRMYTDEHSPVCSVRFGNSFTLNVVDPLALEGFIRDLQKFADAAHELHYGPGPQREPALSEEMAQLQQKLEDCGVGDWASVEEESDEFYSNLIDQNLKKAADASESLSSMTEQINDARARYLREEADPEESAAAAEPSKVERLMRGTVSAPQIDPMNDPMNW